MRAHGRLPRAAAISGFLAALVFRNGYPQHGGGRGQRLDFIGVIGGVEQCVIDAGRIISGELNSIEAGELGIPYRPGNERQLGTGQALYGEFQRIERGEGLSRHVNLLHAVHTVQRVFKRRTGAFRQQRNERGTG